MKKAIFTMAIVLLAVAAQAQIKVHDDNWVSIGCLNGDFGVQVTPIGYTYFRTQDNANYGWANQSIANNDTQRHWIVKNIQHGKSNTMFYVSGDGQIHSTSTYITVITNTSKDADPINGQEALNAILRLNGYYFEADSQITPEDIENSEYVSEEAINGMIADLDKKNIELSETIRLGRHRRLRVQYGKRHQHHQGLRDQPHRQR